MPDQVDEAFFRRVDVAPEATVSVGRFLVADTEGS